MNKKDALEFRDEHRPKLLNQVFDKESDWTIRDVIIATTTTAAPIYEKMWTDNISNESALTSYPQIDDYEVFLISHQWPWGSGNLLFRRLEDYLRK